MNTNNTSLIDRARRVGCWSVGVFALMAFFVIGALVSLLNGDILTSLQAVIVAVVLAAIAMWLARRNVQSLQR